MSRLGFRTCAFCDKVAVHSIKLRMFGSWQQISCKRVVDVCEDHVTPTWDAFTEALQVFDQKLAEKLIREPLA